MSQQINLFNPAFQKQKKVFTSVRMVQALGVLLVGTVAIAMYARQTVANLEREAAAGAEQVNAKKIRLASAMTEFAPRQKSKALEAQIAEAETELAGLHEIEGVLKRGRLGNANGYASYFRALARQSASDLWLTGLTIGGEGPQLSLQGRALEGKLVPAYVNRLTTEPVMQGKTFGALQISRPERVNPNAAPGSKPELAPFIDFSLEATGKGGK